MKRFAWLGILVGLLAGGAQAAPFGPVQYSALPNCPSGALQYTLSTATIACGGLPNIGTALPSATTSQLYGGTGAAGAASAVTVGSGLSLSGSTLASTVNLSTALPSATTSQIYGGTGSAGAAQAITLGTGLSITGTTLNATGGSGGVSQIIAGTNVTISPTGGTGVVTINASGGGGGGGTVLSFNSTPITTSSTYGAMFAFRANTTLPALTTNSLVTITARMNREPYTSGAIDGTGVMLSSNGCTTGYGLYLLDNNLGVIATWTNAGAGTGLATSNAGGGYGFISGTNLAGPLSLTANIGVVGASSNGLWMGANGQGISEIRNATFNLTAGTWTVCALAANYVDIVSVSVSVQ